MMRHFLSVALMAVTVIASGKEYFAGNIVHFNHREGNVKKERIGKIVGAIQFGPQKKCRYLIANIGKPAKDFVTVPFKDVWYQKFEEDQTVYKNDKWRIYRYAYSGYGSEYTIQSYNREKQTYDLNDSAGWNENQLCVKKDYDYREEPVNRKVIWTPDRHHDLPNVQADRSAKAPVFKLKPGQNVHFLTRAQDSQNRTEKVGEILGTCGSTHYLIGQCFPTRGSSEFISVEKKDVWTQYFEKGDKVYRKDWSRTFSSAEWEVVSFDKGTKTYTIESDGTKKSGFSYSADSGTLTDQIKEVSSVKTAIPIKMLWRPPEIKPAAPSVSAQPSESAPAKTSLPAHEPWDALPRREKRRPPPSQHSNDPDSVTGSSERRKSPKLVEVGRSRREQSRKVKPVKRAADDSPAEPIAESNWAKIKKFFNSTKVKIVAGVGAAALAVAGYFGYQYFVSPEDRSEKSESLWGKAMCLPMKWKVGAVAAVVAGAFGLYKVCRSTCDSQDDSATARSFWGWRGSKKKSFWQKWKVLIIIVSVLIVLGGAGAILYILYCGDSDRISIEQDLEAGPPM